MRSGGFRRAGPEAVRGLAAGGEKSGLSVPTHLSLPLQSREGKVGSWLGYRLSFPRLRSFTSFTFLVLSQPGQKGPSPYQSADKTLSSRVA